MKFWKNTLFVVILSTLLPVLSIGQGNNKVAPQNDTIKKPISGIDTLFINNQIKSDRFYDSLQTKASKNKITKTALKFLLVNQPENGKYVGVEDLRNEEYYKLYSGKIIRNIEILKLDIFGPSLSDTSQKSVSWIQRFGNKSHIKTREFILKNNLFFQEGDSIDPAQLVDNERLIRELDYIKDASIQIAEVPGSPNQVDVLIITKDVYSAGIYFDLYNSFSGAAEIYENNLAGIGHKLQASMYFNTIGVPLGYNFSYKIGNFGNSFIKSTIQYYNAFYTEKYGIDFSRKFVSYNTKWAGSFKILQTSTIRDIIKVDTSLLGVNLNYSTQDIWIGRSFLLRTNSLQYQNRTRLVFGLRYINNTFYKGPDVSERSDFPYHDNQIILASIAFGRQKHYKSNLIYGFGKTEDIPIGTLLQLNFGPEKDEFYERIYMGAMFSKGIYYPRLGYLNLLTEFGGHYFRKDLEQGVFKIKTNAISNLHYFRKLKLRNFIGIDYTRGFNRFPDERIYLNSQNIWGFDGNYLPGLEKLSLHTEMVAFTDFYVYNFRFLFFGFGDLGLIGPVSESLFKQQIYSGLGIGFRVRNENLVFKTFQIKLAYYPVVPNSIEHFNYVLSGENYNKPINYEPSEPNIIEFQ